MLLTHQDLRQQILFKFKDNSKVCLSTFHRYGYSDYPEFLDAEKYFRDLSRKFPDITLVGDLNLSTVKDWNYPETRCDLESQYIDLCNDLRLSAQVNNSTHRAGNILDQILTNKPNLVTNVAIEPNGMSVRSFHIKLRNY